jgi:sugar transferase (PEP-CTERM/EpsH1 system associated)
MKILFITSRFPYPPIKGDKAIPYQRLKHFSKKHEITLLSFAEDTIDRIHFEEISGYCKEVHIIPLIKRKAYLNIMLKSFSNIPLQVLYYTSKDFKKKLKELLKRNKCDLVHAFMLRIAPYISEYKECPKIIEFIDSMELNMRKRASLEKGIKKWIVREEATRLSKYEKVIAKKFDYTIVVSNIDKDIIGGKNIVVSPLGVDTQIFFCNGIGNRDENLIIFTGNMGYFPNEMAVLYFVESIFPLVQRKIQSVKFWVIGGDVSERVKRLEKKNKSIRVLGFVDSMPDYINRAAVSVCPMKSGSGMQFKIIEALACGVPVITTSVGKGDINLNEEDGLFVADEPEKFADKVLEILMNEDLRKNIAQKAPEAIKDKYSWESSNLILERIYSELGMFQKYVYNLT